MARTGPSQDALRGALDAQRALLPTDADVDPPVLRPATTAPVDAVLLRLVEAVLQGLDAGVEPDRQALTLTVRALAGLLERTAPGRSVEVRVPPYAAVQCVAGPRHTRGNPPNTVEAQPVAFVQLCTGRLAWGAAVADGRVRSSGPRADLSACLPLLG